MAVESGSGGTLDDFRARAKAMWGEERAAEIEEETLRKTAAAVDRMHALSLEIVSGPGFYLGEFSRSEQPEQQKPKQDEEPRDE